ncbi:ABC transporter ATP-binding protein [Acidiluteibacter ferrifornacis]|uniref:ATP-binding cassette domain-containing protein n=1 Tax=Acidiluteibacter ferrifornacis TaxID=2692424 RepID=A0A6N9NNM1_9FLAO|nr:ABC transporter ATP-binding protein [Acidiluteibacter ferrifornacis]NBG66860.1 ATP-binding cassette domain-containing protein [Acidiluteibacter ferrifornacis]
MLEAQNIRKSYGELEVLKGVNLTIGKGEIVSIVGASGAGKTTLLQILGTLESPDSGQLIIKGINTTSLSDKNLSRFRNENIGFVFQFHQLLPEFTAIENICLPAYIKGTSKKVAEKKAIELLKLLNLNNRGSHKPAQLSGGEQQRIAVARALINEPSIIFADEPSGNLDSKSSKELHQLFFTLRNELDSTFVIVTHNEELASMTDRKLTIIDGAF